MIVYMATNKTNGRRYIGMSTKTLEQRKKLHVYDDGTYFHKAVTKYGIDGFEWKVLCNQCTDMDALRDKEKYFIKEYNTYLGDGYNLTEGGDSGNGLSGEDHWSYGKPSTFRGKEHTEESKQLIREKRSKQVMRKGWNHTEETKRKISENCNNTGENNPMYGKNHSEESKKRMSEQRRGKSYSNKMYYVTLPSQEVVLVEGLKGFCEEQGLIYSSVHTYMKRGKPYKGYSIKEIV